MIFNILLTFFFLAACTNVVVREDDPKQIEEFYQTNGTAAFFLPQIPDWADFQSGCLRTKKIRFLNLEAVYKNFNLSYTDSIMFQVRFNLNYRMELEKFQVTSLPLRDEDVLFFKTLDQVKAKFYQNMLPDYKRISIIWVDSVVDEKDDLARLQQVFKNGLFSQGHPVLLSACQDYQTLEQLAKKIGQPQSKIISTEFFTAFDNRLGAVPRFVLDLSLFGENKEINVFTFGKSKPEILSGNYRVINL